MTDTPKKSPKILMQGWPLAVDAFPQFEPKHVGAAKAFKGGRATDHQQVLLWNYLMFSICRIGDLGYRSNSERDSTFADGKKFVGMVLEKLTEINTGTNPEQGN